MNPVLVLTGLFAATVSASPAGWSATFAPELVGKRITSQSLLVVPVDRASQEAAAALEEGLRRAPSPPRLEKWPRPPGDLGRLDDQKIVVAARGVGAQQLAIVRVFPPSMGVEPVAVVAIYDRAGAVVSTFAARKGTALGASAAKFARADVDGVRNIATYRPEFEAMVRAKYLDLEEGITTQYGAKVAEWNRPIQGEAKRRLEWAEFYEVVGRKDLADKMRGFNAARTVVNLTAVGVAAAGIVGAVLTWPQHGELPIVPFMVGGGGIVLGGFVYVIGNLPFPQTLTTAIENRQLVHDYNQRLVRGEVSTRESAPGPQLSFAVGPTGFALSGTF